MPVAAEILSEVRTLDDSRQQEANQRWDDLVSSLSSDETVAPEDVLDTLTTLGRSNDDLLVAVDLRQQRIGWAKLLAGEDDVVQQVADARAEYEKEVKKCDAALARFEAAKERFN